MRRRGPGRCRGAPRRRGRRLRGPWRIHFIGARGGRKHLLLDACTAPLGAGSWPLGVRPKPSVDAERRYGHHRGTCFDTDVISAPRHDRHSRRSRARRHACGRLGRRSQSRAERLSGPDDRAPVRALARQLQLRPRSGRHVRGRDGRLEADGWREGRRRQRVVRGSRRGREVRAVAAVRQLGDDAPGVRRRARSDDALLRGERRRSAVAHERLDPVLPAEWRRHHAPAGRERRRQGLGAVAAHARHRQPPRCAERRQGDGRLPLHARRAWREVADRRRLRRPDAPVIKEG